MSKYKVSYRIMIRFSSNKYDENVLLDRANYNNI